MAPQAPRAVRAQTTGKNKNHKTSINTTRGWVGSDLLISNTL